MTQEGESGPKQLMLNGIGALAAEIYRDFKATTGGARAAVKNSLALGFSKLIQESYERRSRVKTLVDPETPLDLRSIYVDAVLSSANSTVAEEEFFHRLATENRAVIVGTAGAGKSFLLRSIFLKILDCWAEPIPIFVELRSVNEDNQLPFANDLVRTQVLKTIKAYIRSFDDRQLEHALYTGKIALLLDALDEVSPDRKARVVSEITAIAEQNRRAKIFLTSRPDEVFEGWEEFPVYRVLPLTPSAAGEVIRKLPYEPSEIKDKFDTEVIQQRFDLHSEFVGVPLLLVMMLIVYEQFAEVPSKIINFYGRAFDALFNRHDSMKQGFKRSLATKLSLEEFKSLFSAFCAGTYAADQHTFSHEVTDRYLVKAIAVADVSCTSAQALSDLTQGVCLLQQDGLDWTFAHRSFQEYFTAKFLISTNWDEDRRLRFLAHAGWRMSRDNVTEMMQALNPAGFIEGWMLPAAKRALAGLELSQRPHNTPMDLWIFSKLVSNIWLAFEDDKVDRSQVVPTFSAQLLNWLAPIEYERIRATFRSFDSANLGIPSGEVTLSLLLSWQVPKDSQMPKLVAGASTVCLLKPAEMTLVELKSIYALFYPDVELGVLGYKLTKLVSLLSEEVSRKNQRENELFDPFEDL